MLQLGTTPHDDYFLAQLTGLVSVQAWEGGLQALETATADSPHDRLLVDLTGLVGWLGVPERTVVGALMATHLRRMRKVALHIQAKKIAGVVEAEARRLGLDLRIFPGEEDARRWLVA